MQLQRKYSRREEIQISNIVSEISQIKEMKLGSDVFADVKLVFSCGKSLLAHQLVLGAASPVLMELLLQTSDTSTTSEDLVSPYQLLEYQTDMRRCRFDTLGKQTSAHLAGGPTPYTGWVPPARWVSADAASPSPPIAREGWQPAHAVGEVHPPCGRDVSPPARWVDLFPAHNPEGLLLIDFSQESGRLFVLQ